MMKAADINNLNRRETFEMFADKCKSRANVSICAGLIILGLAIAALVWALNCHPQSPYFDDIDAIFFFAYFISIVCATGCSVLFNYRYKKEIDRLDTPDQLLDLFEKKLRYEKRFFILPVIILMAYIFYDGLIQPFVRLDTNRADMFYTFEKLAYVIGTVLCTLYVCKPRIISRRDEKLIDQLYDFIWAGKQ